MKDVRCTCIGSIAVPRFVNLNRCTCIVAQLSISQPINHSTILKQIQISLRTLCMLTCTSYTQLRSKSLIDFKKIAVKNPALDRKLETKSRIATWDGYADGLDRQFLPNLVVTTRQTDFLTATVIVASEVLDRRPLQVRSCHSTFCPRLLVAWYSTALAEFILYGLPSRK